jgi:hypothetical protein
MHAAKTAATLARMVRTFCSLLKESCWRGPVQGPFARVRMVISSSVTSYVITAITMKTNQDK